MGLYLDLCMMLLLHLCQLDKVVYMFRSFVSWVASPFDLAEFWTERSSYRVTADLGGCAAVRFGRILDPPQLVLKIRQFVSVVVAPLDCAEISHHSKVILKA